MPSTAPQPNDSDASLVLHAATTVGTDPERIAEHTGLSVELVAEIAGNLILNGIFAGDSVATGWLAA